MYGRAIRITDNGGCVTVQDRATSFKTTKCANTSEVREYNSNVYKDIDTQYHDSYTVEKISSIHTNNMLYLKEATAEGTSELFTLLIKIGQMSYDDVGLKPPTPKPGK